MKHACPCCGYRTLPSREYYDLCPVCWWEDDGSEPWELSGPNATTLLEAQQEFLADDRPFRRRDGKVRPPRRSEARDADWSPIQVTPELVGRIDEERRQAEHFWREQAERAEEEMARNPEGAFADYNAGVRELEASISSLSHREVKERLQALARASEFEWPPAYLELFARLQRDRTYYEGHFWRCLWWIVRYPRAGRVRQRWREVRTGEIRFAG